MQAKISCYHFLPRLKELRQREGVKISLAELARRVGVDYSYMWKVETQRCRVNDEVIDSIAAQLKTTPDDLRQPVAS